MAAACAPARAAVDRHRRRERTVLCRSVQTQLATGLERSCDSRQGVSGPAHGEREFRRYLECRTLAHGFARARCSDCAHDFRIAWSCKGRGVCPACTARRMVDTAAQLADHVFPRLPVRQWVRLVPKRRRDAHHRLHHPRVRLREMLSHLASRRHRRLLRRPGVLRCGKWPMPSRANSTRKPHRQRATNSLSASPGQRRTTTIRSASARTACTLGRRPRRPRRRPRAILVLRLRRGLHASSAHCLRVETALTARQSLEHFRKGCRISYPFLSVISGTKSRWTTRQVGARLTQAVRQVGTLSGWPGYPEKMYGME